MQKLTADTPKIADLARRLEKDPGSRLFLELAKAYHEEGRFAEAASTCEHGIKRHPGYLSARVLAGRIYFDMGRLPESREEMEGVLAQAPDNLVARRILALISLEEGDLTGSLERFQTLLAFNPTDSEAAGKIREIEASLKSAKPPDQPAAGDVGAAGETRPPEPVDEAAEEILEPGVLATPTLAEIFMQQGLTERAAGIYREILAGDPVNLDVRARLEEIEAMSASPVEDAAAQTRRRTIRALGSWLEAIRDGSRG